MAKPSDDKGPLDFRIEPDLHSNCTAINSHPVIVTHVDANHLDSKQEADVNQVELALFATNDAIHIVVFTITVFIASVCFGDPMGFFEAVGNFFVSSMFI